MVERLAYSACEPPPPGGGATVYVWLAWADGTVIHPDKPNGPARIFLIEKKGTKFAYTAGSEKQLGPHFVGGLLPLRLHSSITGNASIIAAGRPRGNVVRPAVVALEMQRQGRANMSLPAEGDRKSDQRQTIPSELGDMLETRGSALEVPEKKRHKAQDRCE